MLCELILLMSIESYANPSVLLFSPINKDTFSYSGTEYFAYIYDGLKDNICELKEANCSLKDTGKHSSTHKATFITEYRSSEILPAEASNFDNQRITGQIQIDWKNQRTRERQWTKSWTRPQLGSFLPNIFAQAAMISTKGENIHIEDGQNEIIDNAKESKQQKPRGKNQITLEKFICKYRKSCYETGKIPKIQNLSFFSGYWFAPTSQSKENNNERRTNDDTYNNAMASKIKCKYRLSCYMHTKLPTEKNDEQRTLLMGKALPPSGKKNTLKEIAERTMKRLKAAEEKAASRPIPKSIKIEKKINAVGEILNRKLLCKYRKSCYKTGTIINREKSTLLAATTNTQSSHNLLSVASYNELKQLEKKIYCKYRKSCYESGIKPEIEPEIQIHSLRDLAALPQVVETRKMTYQEQCKYRKSCYETGIVPQKTVVQENTQTEISSVIPSSIRELKTLCRYRKSCYVEVAQAATAETINTIRRRRLKEKEANKRKARREKHRKRLRWNIGSKSNKKVTRKEWIVDSNSQENKDSRLNKNRNMDNITVNEPFPASDIDHTNEDNHNSVKSHTTGKTDEKKHISIKKKMAKKNIENNQEMTKVDIEMDVPTNRTETIEAIDMLPLHKNRIVKEPVSTKSKKKMTPRVNMPENSKKKKVGDDTKLESVKTNLTKNNTPKDASLESTKHLSQPKEIHSQNGKRDKPKLIIKKRKTKQYELKNDKIDKNMNNQDQQKHSDFCKYRKSCYSTGEKPTITQTFSTIYDSFTEHVDKSYDKQSITTRSETNKKLECKYRKSCYKEDIRKIEGTADSKKERLKTTTTHQEIEPKHLSSKDEQINQRNKPVAPNTENVFQEYYSNDSERSTSEKLMCKYRKSCYDSSNPIGTKRHSSVTYHVPELPQKINKCNKYYLSCQEILGLPIKQKVPIGPNGKRLCSKKKLQ